MTYILDETSERFDLLVEVHEVAVSHVFTSGIANRDIDGVDAKMFSNRLETDGDGVIEYKISCAVNSGQAVPAGAAACPGDLRRRPCRA